MASRSAAPMLRILFFIRSSSRAAACQQQHRHLSSSTAARPPVCYEDDQHNITAASIPSAVWECLHQLRAAGHEVLLVGGAVRDLLLQCGEPKDYDILTSAQLKQVKELFSKPRIIGKNFPICQLDSGGIKIDISSMHTRPARGWDAGAAAGSSSSSSSAVPPDVAEHLLGADGAPGRGRRSSVVPHRRQQQPTSWATARRHNATARDFTVNALLYDPFQAVLFDYVGGMSDVQHKLLRCVGDPGRKFTADPVCLLRAVRCAARTGLQVEAATAAALQQHAHLVTSLNLQRLTAELTAMLGYSAAAASLEILQQLQLMQHLLPLHYTYSSRVWQENRRSSSRGVLHGSSSSSRDSKQQQQDADRDATAVVQPTLDTAAAAAASSQLGQLLLQTRQLTHQPLRSSTQQQEEEIACHQGWEHNLLHRVAAALDQRVSVQQPAQAEVLLACLTAPLLVERLHKAVRQLSQQLLKQQGQQQQQQHAAIYTLQDEDVWQHKRQQQFPDVSELFASQVLLQQQVQQAQQQHQQQQHCQSERWYEQHAHSMHSTTGGVWQQPQVTSAARAFSSSSSSSSSNGGSSSGSAQLPGTVLICPSTAAAAQELLNGAKFGDVLHRQAVQLASEVCALQQSPYTDSTLFGISTPQLAADLLATHIAVCKEHRVQQQQQQQTLLPARRKGIAEPPPPPPPPQQQQQQRTRLAEGRSLDSIGSSSSGWRSCNSTAASSTSSSTGGNRRYSSEEIWLDFDSHLLPPRTNKQYRRLMQAQQRQAAAELAGCLGSIPSPDAMLLAAAFAANSDALDFDSSDSRRSSEGATMAGGRGLRQKQQRRQCAAVVAGVELSYEEHLLHQVLTTARAGFDTLEQQVAELQVLLTNRSMQMKH